MPIPGDPLPISPALWTDTNTGRPTDQFYQYVFKLDNFVATNISALNTQVFGSSGGGGGGSVAASRGYIDGLVLSNDVATPNTKLDVAAGVARDDTNAATIVLSATVIDCTTNGVNGLDTGSLANSTWYHVFAIAKAGSSGALASTSATSPILPTGFTVKRRIGSFKTDGSAHIIAFVQYGDQFMWSTPVLDVNAVSPGTAAVLRVITVPTNVKVQALIVVDLYAPNGSTDSPAAFYVSDPALSNITATISAESISLFTTSTSQYEIAAQVNCWTNTSAQIRTRSQFSGANTQLSISTYGWIDPRGKNS